MQKVLIAAVAAVLLLGVGAGLALWIVTPTPEERRFDEAAEVGQKFEQDLQEMDEPAPIEGGEGAPMASDAPDEPTTSAASASASIGPDTIRKTKSCEFNQPCEVYPDGTTITVTNAERANSITFLGDTQQGNFVIVSYTYVSGGNKPLDTQAERFSLRDGNGTEYTSDFDLSSEVGIERDASLIYETVQPNVPMQGTEVFAVPPDAANFEVGVSDIVPADDGRVIGWVPLPF